MTSAACMRLLDRLSRHEHPVAANDADRPAARIPDLGYRPTIHESQRIPLAAPRDIRAWQVHWKPASRSPVDGLGYQSVGGFYLPRGDGHVPRPGILVLPVLRDPRNLASGTMARYLASQGFAALELRSGHSFLDRVRVTEDGRGPTWEDVETEMIRDGRRGLDWLSGQSQVDGRRLGLIGVSHGAIIGPCVMGADPRVGAGVFCMGGADEAMIVARSRERSVRRFRERIMRAHGLTDPEELLRLGRERASRTEPLRYAAAVDPRAVLLFKTRRDRAVVPEAQDKLWEALGRPRRITLPFGHVGFGLAFYYAARRAAEFLWERFS
jgi:dienelactone hydrolase